jgi:hypothetical protein
MSNDITCQYKNIPVSAHMKTGAIENLTIRDLSGKHFFSVRKNNDPLFSGKAEKYIVCQVLANLGVMPKNLEISGIKISAYGV